MQELIINGLLAALALLAAGLLAFGRRPAAAMTKKQTAMLWRILAATALLLALQLLGAQAFAAFGPAGHGVGTALFPAGTHLFLRKSVQGGVIGMHAVYSLAARRARLSM